MLYLQEPLIQPLISEFTKLHQVFLFVKRLDLIHPTIKGNKWFKLKHNLFEAQKQEKNTLLTFGGAYSNHIYATAAAGKLHHLQTIGIIRGEETLPLNPILSFAESQGMQFYYVSRQMYKQMREDYANVLQYLHTILPENILQNCYILPEGGANELAIEGCKEISQNCEDFDAIVCAYATGGTYRGILAGNQTEKVQKVGIMVLKTNPLPDFTLDLETGIYVKGNDRIFTNFHFGGYAKTSPALLKFVDDFCKTYQVPIEPIYTGKMFFGLFELIAKGYFPKKSCILAIHTGGVY